MLLWSLTDPYTAPEEYRNAKTQREEADLILKYVKEIIHPKYFGHCAVCGYGGTDRADFERHLTESCHWLSDEHGNKWR